jgi:cysteine synthase A
VILIPRTQTEEKKNTLRQAGATLLEIIPKPYKNPNNYSKVSGRLANELACIVRRATRGSIGNHQATS